MTKFLRLIFVIVLLICSSGSGSDTLYIHCLDVGQGDATLILSPTGQTMLVDGGYNGRGTDKILPYLDNLNITSLDYIVATVDKRQIPGPKAVTWDASSFASGIYFYRLQAGDYLESKKMILLK
jgi:hypothetical protein